MTQVSPAQNSRARGTLAVALDFDDVVEASRLARQIAPWFGIAKVGLELFSAAGPEAVEEMIDEGFEVFVDLKLYDIPTTVGRAATVIGGLGARYLTIHTQGGLDMIRAGVEGLARGAEDAGLPPPFALGVTVLTSDSRHSPGLVAERVALAVQAGCGGVVCSADDLEGVRSQAPGLICVVPGIRPRGSDPADQARIATPAQAVAGGADVLVIGRPVTRAGDPAGVAQAISSEVGEAMAGR